MTTSLKQSLLVATILSSAVATPALAQQAAADDGAIIVTAQRIEQDIQDVPISITVFDQEKLDNNNILNAKDLATFTPGVYAQTRFGNDVTTYTIRGFAQEQRTTATVGTYFAEVVAPRGNGVSQGGDGASPGALFDLQNVQVLKGPQGTLFGRNTTGGAVLLVPVKPKDEFEGYVEGTVGKAYGARAPRSDCAPGGAPRRRKRLRPAATTRDDARFGPRALRCYDPATGQCRQGA